MDGARTTVRGTKYKKAEVSSTGLKQYPLREKDLWSAMDTSQGRREPQCPGAVCMVGGIRWRATGVWPSAAVAEYN